MKIEDIIDKLNKESIPAVVILKANEGYSVIPMSKEIYRETFLMANHWNGKTVEEALSKLFQYFHLTF